jgi:hypothetical protein
MKTGCCAREVLWRKRQYEERKGNFETRSWLVVLRTDRRARCLAFIWLSWYSQRGATVSLVHARGADRWLRGCGYNPRWSNEAKESWQLHQSRVLL